MVCAVGDKYSIQDLLTHRVIDTHVSNLIEFRSDSSEALSPLEVAARNAGEFFVERISNHGRDAHGQLQTWTTGGRDAYCTMELVYVPSLASDCAIYNDECAVLYSCFHMSRLAKILLMSIRQASESRFQDPQILGTAGVLRHLQRVLVNNQVGELEKLLLGYCLNASLRVI